MIHYNWTDDYSTLIDISEENPNNIEIKVYDKKTDHVADIIVTEKQLKELHKFIGTYLEIHQKSKEKG